MIMLIRVELINYWSFIIEKKLHYSSNLYKYFALLYKLNFRAPERPMDYNWDRNGVSGERRFDYLGVG